MSGTTVRELRRTYLSLGLGEIVAAAVFSGAMLWAVTPRLAFRADRLALWAALMPLVVILCQAGIYWLTARVWIGRGAMPYAVRILYRCFWGVDAVLLAVGLVGIVAARPSSVAVVVLAFAVWLFGVAEYINYFFVRLAYPAHCWLKEVARRRTPRLVKDLRGHDSHRSSAAAHRGA